MTGYLRRFGPVAVVLAVVALAAFPSTTNAFHPWNGYHWARTANPFTLKLGDNVSSAWDQHLQTTSNDWTQSSVLDTVIVAGGTRPKNCRPTSGRVEVCNAAYGNNGWLGLAQIWVNGKHITQGLSKMNDTYFRLPQYNTPEERNHVMCQEVGHTIGLGHQDESGATLHTCMDYSTSPTSQHPNAHDYEELESIYAHLDTFTTIGMAGLSEDADMSEPAQWGPRVASLGDGRGSLHERDLGAGRKVITFVFHVR